MVPISINIIKKGYFLLVKYLKEINFQTIEFILRIKHGKTAIPTNFNEHIVNLSYQNTSFVRKKRGVF